MRSDYERARRRVKKKAEFRSHLISYLIIMGFLFFINVFSNAGPGGLWVIWPALGWGVGLAFHGFTAYGIIPDKDQEEEMVEEEMRRMELKESSDYLDEEEPLDLKEIRKEVRYDEDDFV